jgi:hypothetical protein
MCNVKVLTRAQVAQAVDVVFDAAKQQTLLQTVDHPDRWMLEFVFDLSMQRELLMMSDSVSNLD